MSSSGKSSMVARLLKERKKKRLLKRAMDRWPDPTSAGGPLADFPQERQGKFVEGKIFETNKIYKRQDLHRRFGGQRRAGISTPAHFPFIFIFSGETSVVRKVGYTDGWKDEHTFFYTGQGQEGDQTWTKGNLALRTHHRLSKRIFLFHIDPRLHSGYVRFIDELQFQSYQYVQRPDTESNMRRAILFTLTTVTASASSPLSTNILSSSSSTTSFSSSARTTSINPSTSSWPGSSRAKLTSNSSNTTTKYNATTSVDPHVRTPTPESSAATSSRQPTTEQQANSDIFPTTEQRIQQRKRKREKAREEERRRLQMRAAQRRRQMDQLPVFQKQTTKKDGIPHKKLSSESSSASEQDENAQTKRIPMEQLPSLKNRNEQSKSLSKSSLSEKEEECEAPAPSEPSSTENAEMERGQTSKQSQTFKRKPQQLFFASSDDEKEERDYQPEQHLPQQQQIDNIEEVVSYERMNGEKLSRLQEDDFDDPLLLDFDEAASREQAENDEQEEELDFDDPLLSIVTENDERDDEEEVDDGFIDPLLL
ncbi:HNHc domain-containing protein [Balamuthia mandrillaris]